MGERQFFLRPIYIMLYRLIILNSNIYHGLTPDPPPVVGQALRRVIDYYVAITNYKYFIISILCHFFIEKSNQPACRRGRKLLAAKTRAVSFLDFTRTACSRSGILCLSLRQLRAVKNIDYIWTKQPKA